MARKKRYIRPEDRVRIVALARQRTPRLTNQRIATITGWSEPAVRLVLRRAKVRRWPKIDEGQLRALVQAGATVPEIVRTLKGPTKGKVRAVLKKLGLKAVRAPNSGAPGKPRRFAPPKRQTPLGARLQELRLAAGLTARKVAGAIGVNLTVLHHYEAGTVRLRREPIEKLERFFRLKPGELAALVPAEGWTDRPERADDTLALLEQALGAQP